MVITHFGNGCFRVQSGDTSMLINPENNRLKADITLRTLVATAPEDVAAATGAGEDGGGLAIAMPGEYEEKDIEIVGYPVAAESTAKFLKTVYVVRWEGLKLAVLGHLSTPLDASLMEELAEPDVLFLPAGGDHFLEPEPAAKAAKQLEARIVIPSFYKDPAPFLKALGVKGETMERFTFKAKDIADNKGRAIVLSVA